jgi:hypothetical protein
MILPSRIIVRAVLLTLVALLQLGCQATFRVLRDGPGGFVVPPPCSDKMLIEHIDQTDSMDACEQYRRIERALNNSAGTSVNEVVPRLPASSCDSSRWGISPDPRVDESIAYALVLCYGARMGRHEQTYASLLVLDANNSPDGGGYGVTLMPHRDEYLAGLRAYLGCHADNEG